MRVEELYVDATAALFRACKAMASVSVTYVLGSGLRKAILAIRDSVPNVETAAFATAIMLVQ